MEPGNGSEIPRVGLSAKEKDLTKLKKAKEESLNEPFYLAAGHVSAGPGVDGPVLPVHGSLRQNLNGEVNQK
jgi:hypothetical protein